MMHANVCVLTRQVSRELIGPEYIALGNGYLSFMIALGALTAGPAAGKHMGARVPRDGNSTPIGVNTPLQGSL